MLYTHPPGKFQLLVGTILALAASTAAAVGAWSSQEPQVVYLPASTPQPELVTVTTLPVTPEPALADRAAEPSAPSPTPVAPEQNPEDHDKPAPPEPAVETAPPEPKPTPPAPPATPPAPPAPEANPLPGDAGEAAPEPESAPAPPADPESSSEPASRNDRQPARLVEASRPSFPRTVFKPRLVSYPGMPEAEQPGPDWEPDGRIWRMEVRVTVDETGEPIETRIADNNLGGGGMVRRYERLALRAVSDWRYEPARVGGEPVTSELMLAFHFDNRTGARPLSIGYEGPMPVKTRTYNKVPPTWK